MDSFIAEHLRGVSRTYALVIPMLPPPLADAVGIAYLLMRVVDTLEDAPQLADVARHEHLMRLDAALCSIAGTPLDFAAAGEPDCGTSGLARAEQTTVANHPLGRRAGTTPTGLDKLGELPAERALMAHLPDVLGRVVALEAEYREPVVRCARTMIRGVLYMLARSRQRERAYPAVASPSELRDYCYYVAGDVGEMLCAMMAHYLRSPMVARLQPVAIELGIGLQLVNILKDSWKDAAQGRRYLPPDDSGAAEPGASAAAGLSRGALLLAVADEARRCLRSGMEFVLALPPAAAGMRLFCGLPLAWGAMTLARLERSVRRTSAGVAERLAGGTKVGRGAIASSILRFRQLAGDDGALRCWLDRMLRPLPA